MKKFLDIIAVIIVVLFLSGMVVYSSWIAPMIIVVALAVTWSIVRIVGLFYERNPQ